MTGLVRIDPSSPLVPSEQVRTQLAAAISSGTLVAGTRLPTVRGLAGDLGLAVNTVAKVYRALESAGLVQTRSRAGTVVTAAGDPTRQRLQQAARDYAATARELGVDADEAMRLVRAALEG
jgi:DNA-binding transcriptional regulator YhcF (GntR family)